MDKGVLSKLAFETDGAVMLAEDALQLISLYNSLSDLLHGEVDYYKMKVGLEKSSGTWKSGDQVNLLINLSLLNTLDLEFPVLFEIP